MRALLLLVLVVAAPLAAAYPDPARVPFHYDSACSSAHDRRFVHDYVELLPYAYGAEIEGAACDVYAATSAHYVLVTVPDTDGEILENYALHLFEEWGVGDERRLDGLMLLYVDDHLGSGQSAVRIEVGYGLEGVVNSRVTEEAWERMVEARDLSLEVGESPEEARAFALGMGSLFLLEVVAAGYTDAGPAPPEPSAPPLLFWIVLLLLVVLLVWALARSARGERGWGYGHSSGAWASRAAGIWISSGGLGAMRGGGSFGGGRSGGGGRGGRF